MADKKITELPNATLPILGSGARVELVQGGVNVQTDPDNIGGGSIPDASPTTKGIAKLYTDVAAQNTDGAPDQNAVFDALALKAALADIIGVQDLWIPAGAMQPTVTNGCDILRPYEMATSLFNVTALAFDQTTQEFADFQMSLPRKYNNSTLTIVPYWTALAGTGTVQWGVSFGSYRNDDALTVAFGTAQTSDDTLLATNDLHIGPATSAITPAGTLQDSNFIGGRISRNPASDTLNADALLFGIMVRVTVDAGKDG